jgi:uncharacterized protein with FMN-binding domain
MKKILLSVLTIGLFLGYGLLQNNIPRLAGVNVIKSIPTPLPTDVPTNSNSQPTANEPTPTQDTTQSVIVTPTSGATPPPKNNSQFKDGEFTGSVADAFYGNIQARAVIKNGKIIDVQFLQYPSDRDRSIEINSYAMPILKQQAITVQSAKVDGVSGATDSSQAFMESLGVALAQAANL